MRRNYFSIGKKDWNKFEKNNARFALYILYVKREKIYNAYLKE